MSLLRSGSIKLFRFAGIQVYLHWTWFVIAVCEVYWRRGIYSSVIWNIAEYVALFAIVTLHEFGHMLACRQVGGQTHDIVLWPLGGIAYVSPPPRPGAVLWSISAGPLVNLVLGPVLLGIAIACNFWGWATGQNDFGLFLNAVNFTNALLFCFNMLPIYPLDGGQILQSLLWFRVGRVRSLELAAKIGLVGVVAMGTYGLFVNKWYLFIALFAGQRCFIGLSEAKYLRKLEQAPRHRDFACPVCHQAPPGGPMWGCRNCGGRFDPFSTNAACPHCGTTQATTMCPYCGTSHAIATWRTNEPPVLEQGP